MKNKYRIKKYEGSPGVSMICIYDGNGNWYAVATVQSRDSREFCAAMNDAYRLGYRKGSEAKEKEIRAKSDKILERFGV